MNIKMVRIILLVLIIIGLGLLATQKLWVPRLVNQILISENNTAATKTFAQATAGWLTYSDTSTGVTFKYPAQLPTTYIHTVDWPPKVAVTNSAYSCAQGGKLTDQAGVTVEETLNGTNYCISKQDEGAAGSTYSNYTYASEVENKLVIFTFTIREVDCGNYPQPQMTACNTERGKFDITPIATEMFQTFHTL